MNRSKSKESGRESLTFTNYIKICLVNTLIALLCALLLTAAFSAVFVSQEKSQKFFDAFITLLHILFPFVAGFLAMKKVGRASLICGLVTGAIFSFVTLAVSLCLNSPMSEISKIITDFIIITVSSIFGALVAQRKGKRRKKH